MRVRLLCMCAPTHLLSQVLEVVQMGVHDHLLRQRLNPVELVIIPNCKHQSAPDQLDHVVKHIARMHVWGGGEDTARAES